MARGRIDQTAQCVSPCALGVRTSDGAVSQDDPAATRSVRRSFRGGGLVFKLRCAVILFLLCVCTTAASLSGKYRSWDKSTDAYFLTSEERAQWKSVHTDSEAEKF